MRSIQGVSEAPTVAPTGGIYAEQDSELAPGCAGGRSHRLARPGQVGTAGGGDDLSQEQLEARVEESDDSVEACIDKLCRYDKNSLELDGCGGGRRC